MRRDLVLLSGTVVLAGAALLYAVDPANTQLLPPCPLHALTGLYCPGCGATRAAHQFLHGHVAAAFDLNPLLVVALPVGLFLWCRRLACVGWKGARATPAPQGNAAPQGARPSPWLWALLAVAIAFGVARNLPWPAVRWMAP